MARGGGGRAGARKPPAISICQRHRGGVVKPAVWRGGLHGGPPASHAPGLVSEAGRGYKCNERGGLSPEAAAAPGRCSAGDSSLSLSCPPHPLKTLGKGGRGVGGGKQRGNASALTYCSPVELIW